MATSDTKSDYLVESLPGFKGEVPFRQYAGHIPLGDETDPHYFFWLCEKDEAAEKAPLLIWLNGGPGASSISGLLYENGPFRVEEDLSLRLSETRWNRLANVLYVDQPAGTGLSTVGEAGYVKSLEDVTEQFTVFFANFLKAFPDYEGRTVYFAGESFAGHYIPHIANRFRDSGKVPDLSDVSLGGLAIGNGWVDPAIQVQAQIDFAFSTGVIDVNTREMLQQDYDEGVPMLSQPRPYGKNPLDTIINQIAGASGTKGLYVNRYDFELYDEASGIFWPEKVLTPIKEYLNQEAVRTALNAEAATAEWEDMRSEVFGALSTEFDSGALPLYSSLVEEMPVLFYFGTEDLIANHLGATRLTRALSWSGRDAYLEAPTKAWLVNGEMAGYIKRSENLLYLKVLDGSHMVPYSVPEQAFDMMERFLSGRSFSDE